MLDCLKCHKQDLIRPFSLRNPSICESGQAKIKRNSITNFFVSLPDFYQLLNKIQVVLIKSIKLSTKCYVMLDYAMKIGSTKI